MKQNLYCSTDCSLVCVSDVLPGMSWSVDFCKQLMSVIASIYGHSIVMNLI